MSFIWTVAWRLLREGRFQTALILGGVTIGVGVIVYITAIVNGLLGMAERNAFLGEKRF